MSAVRGDEASQPGTSAVDAVVSLCGSPVRADDLVDTGDRLLTRWLDGRVERLVERATGGLLRPFESRAQILCCQDH